MMGVLPALLLGLAASSSPYECTYLTPHDKVPTHVHRYNGSMLVSWSPLSSTPVHSRPIRAPAGAPVDDGRGPPGCWGPLGTRCTEWTG